MSANRKNNMGTDRLKAKFKEVFGHDAQLMGRAPGRVNLIGEHIDYCGGPVLPMAIERSVVVLASPAGDNRIRLHSIQHDQTCEATIPPWRSEDADWANYPLGVVDELEKAYGGIGGFDALIAGDVPLGSGLSSSAAIEVATGKTTAALINLEIEPLHLAQLCQRAENLFVGVNCGLMDQAASACCEENRALLLDCATPKYNTVPFPSDKISVVIAHSGVYRGLSASAYNERRSQCEEALRQINSLAAKAYPNLSAVPEEVFQQYSDELPDVLRKRARHVVSETARVYRAVEAMRRGELEELGQLLNESHFSLRDDFEVSCLELDRLSELCRGFEDAFGSRLTGAGFGGCTVTLVKPTSAIDLIEFLEDNYYHPGDIEPLAFSTRPAPGATVSPL